MSGKKAICYLFIALILFSSCASTTLIQTNPGGAKVYVDGIYRGETPYQYTDSKIIGATTFLQFKKDGYKDYNASFSRAEEPDVVPIVLGFFFLVPWLWAMKYYPVHTFDLEPLAGTPAERVNPPATVPSSKAERLRELKQLLDDKLITQQDYDKQKEKILQEP